MDEPAPPHNEHQQADAANGPLSDTLVLHPMSEQNWEKLGTLAWMNRQAQIEADEHLRKLREPPRKQGSEGDASHGHFIPNDNSHLAQRGHDQEITVALTLEELYTGHRVVVPVNGEPRGLNLPAGTSDGARLRIPCAGSPGRNGGQRGDLYVTIQQQPHDRFERVGDDLYATTEVLQGTLIHGGPHTFNSLTGPVEVMIPRGHDMSTRLRITGKGFPVKGAGGRYGDLLLRLLVK